MTRFRLRFCFDAGSGTALWSANDEARQRFDYPVMPERVPVSPGLQQQLEAHCQWFDRSLNFADPAGPGLFSAEECERFNAQTMELLERLTRELGPEFEIVNEFKPLRE